MISGKSGLWFNAFLHKRVASSVLGATRRTSYGSTCLTLLASCLAPRAQRRGLGCMYHLAGSRHRIGRKAFRRVGLFILKLFCLLSLEIWTALSAGNYERTVEYSEPYMFFRWCKASIVYVNCDFCTILLFCQFYGAIDLFHKHPLSYDVKW